MAKDYLWLNLREIPYFRALLRAVEAGFMSKIELPTPILDVGCGDGHFASVTYDRDIDIGIDLDLSSLREAQDRSLYRMLIQAAGHRIPVPGNTFSSAISNSVLEHIRGVETVLGEVSRVLKPGASFVFTVPNPGYRSQLSVPRKLRQLRLRRLANRYEKWFMEMSRTYNLFKEEGWISRLQNANFELVDRVDYFPPASLAALEWGHYFGVPCLLSRWLTGRWILSPTRWNLAITERIIRRYYRPEPVEEGTYSYYHARKI